MAPFISAAQFERVYGLLRQERKIHTQERATIRRFLEAVFWIDRSGAQWRFLPTEYGEWNSVADDPDLQAVLIDATVVRAHACAAGAPPKTAARRRRGWGARAAASAPSSTSSATPSATR